MCRLYDVMIREDNLYMVFEFVDMDLKKFFDKMHERNKRLAPDLIKVHAFSNFHPQSV